MFCPGRLPSWVGDGARGWFVVLWPRQNRGSYWPLVGGIVFGRALLASVKAGVIGRRHAGQPERVGQLLVLRRLCFTLHCRERAMKYVRKSIRMLCVYDRHDRDRIVTNNDIRNRAKLSDFVETCLLHSPPKTRIELADGSETGLCVAAAPPLSMI